jgi:hypothetical protein
MTNKCFLSFRYLSCNNVKFRIPGSKWIFLRLRATMWPTGCNIRMTSAAAVRASCVRALANLAGERECVIALAFCGAERHKLPFCEG